MTDAVVGQVMARIDAHIPPTLQSYAEEILRLARRPLDNSEAGRAYYRHPTTVNRTLRNAGLPPLGKLIVWFRLFHAAHLLEGPRSVENVAFVLDFPSRTALCNQFRRYAGVTPGSLKANGGLTTVVQEFERRCSSAKWSLH